MLFLTFLVMSAGFAALALAMERHHRDVFARTLTNARRNRFRICGTGLLLLSLLACILACGIQFGLVWFIGLSGLAAVLVLLGLAFFPPPRTTTSRNANA